MFKVFLQYICQLRANTVFNEHYDITKWYEWYQVVSIY